jgi:hypothetical protein
MKEGRYPESSPNYPGAAYRLHVCMERPRLTTIRFQGRDNGETDDSGFNQVRTFALAMPWTLTFVLYHNEGLAKVKYLAVCNTDGLQPHLERTELFKLALPNMTDGDFCLGDLRLNSHQSPAEKTNRTVRFIQESTWNNDLWPRWGKDDNDTPNVKSLADWAKKTEDEGPGFWRRLRLLSLERTFGAFVKELTT